MHVRVDAWGKIYVNEGEAESGSGVSVAREPQSIGLFCGSDSSASSDDTSVIQ